MPSPKVFGDLVFQRVRSSHQDLVERGHLRLRTNIMIIYKYHCDDVIMTTVASQITSLAVVYSIVHSGADERKHQSSASPLAFVRGIHRDRRIPSTNGQLRGKCFHLMMSSCATSSEWRHVSTMAHQITENYLFNSLFKHTVYETAKHRIDDPVCRWPVVSQHKWPAIRRIWPAEF